jgi:hypothetical protein
LPPGLTRDNVTAAELYLREASEKCVNLKHIFDLLPEIHLIEDAYEHRRAIIMVGGRVKLGWV